jgi:hypothetical protein
MRYSTSSQGITTTVQLSADASRVSVTTDDGREVRADITYVSSGTCVNVAVQAGHLPMRLRHDLMQTVFELRQLQPPAFLTASIPLGDTELLEEFRHRCDRVATRSAGITCLVDATIDARS